MVDITVLKIDLEGATFVADAPFGERDETADASAAAGGDDLSVEPGPEPASEGGGRRTVGLFAVFVGLLFLVVVAALARRRLREDDESDENARDVADAVDVEVARS